MIEEEPLSISMIMMSISHGSTDSGDRIFCGLFIVNWIVEIFTTALTNKKVLLINGNHHFNSKSKVEDS